MKTILCPIDYSSESAHAVRYAIALSRKMKARIILVHAFETPVLFSDPGFLTVTYTESAIHQAELKKLQAFREKLFGKRGRKNVEGVLVQGLASSRICEIARDRGATLIVMGATGTGAGERLFVGSNASRVIRQAPCMVLLVPRRARFRGLKNVAFATDYSSDNLAHARRILPLARQLGAGLQFIHVATKDAKAEKVSATVAQKLRKMAAANGNVPVQTLAGPSVARSLDRFLRTHKTDCLAVYTRHRTMLQEIFHPGISHKLALHISIPLLVVHEGDLPGQP